MSDQKLNGIAAKLVAEAKVAKEAQLLLANELKALEEVEKKIAATKEKLSAANVAVTLTSQKAANAVHLEEQVEAIQDLKRLLASQQFMEYKSQDAKWNTMRNFGTSGKFATAFR